MTGISLLSDKHIADIKCRPGGECLTISDSRIRGLILKVTPEGHKNWYFNDPEAKDPSVLFLIGDATEIPIGYARQHANKLLKEYNNTLDLEVTDPALNEPISFQTFIEHQYLPFIKSYKRSWRADECYLRNHHLPYFSGMQLHEITRKDIADFQQGMVNAGYAAGTCNRCLVILRYAFNLALKWEMSGINQNPTKDVRLLVDQPKMERFLSEEETQRLYAAISQSDNPLLKFIIPMLLLTGARKREILDARWEHIDLKRRSLLVPLPKGGKPRYIPL